VSGPVVVYDGGCRLCRGAAAAAARLDRRGRLRWAAAEDLAALRACGVEPAAASAASLVVHPGDGRGPLTEVDAVAEVLRAVPLAGRSLAALARAGRPALGPAYRWVARNRRRLNGARPGS
jgi:predicted DCC family thiol-disulfide oxidoreductase YuxK